MKKMIRNAVGTAMLLSTMYLAGFNNEVTGRGSGRV